jgi:hypothetical protein
MDDLFGDIVGGIVGAVVETTAEALVVGSVIPARGHSTNVAGPGETFAGSPSLESRRMRIIEVLIREGFSGKDAMHAYTALAENNLL